MENEREPEIRVLVIGFDLALARSLPSQRAIYSTLLTVSKTDDCTGISTVRPTLTVHEFGPGCLFKTHVLWKLEKDDGYTGMLAWAISSLRWVLYALLGVADNKTPPEENGMNAKIIYD